MISLETNNEIATVTLNRPEKHNAFDDSLIKDLSQAFREVEQDHSVRVMVLASTGKHFSAGADLAWMQRMAEYEYEQNLADAQHLAAMLQQLYSLSKPTIARVQGAAFGGAVGLVSCCDIAVGSMQASFCLSEVKIGLIPATISPYVIEALGARNAKRYFLTAERFDASTALRHGLLHHVCETDGLDDAVMEFARMLMDNGPEAMAHAKKLVADFSGQTINEALIADSSDRIASRRISAEGQAGLKAFLSKRSPAWQSTKTPDKE